MCGKGMSKGVRTDGFFDLCFFGQAFYNSKNHGSSERLSSPVQEKGVFCHGVYFLMDTNLFAVDVNIFLSYWTYGHQTFFVAFTNYLYKAFVQKEIRSE